ncbi:MAG: tetratricopeptide repeat protein [Gemmatimonadetes bacterium]|nr:tetratricopeptide repeat protein [Gemmatimonadota bacterium]
MSVAKVLKLAEHRDRRQYRLAMTRALVHGDPARRILLKHLAEVADLTGSDRVAVVWIDEYGAGLVHPHLILDLLSDRPRRFFSSDPLERAWDLGVPGALDDVIGSARGRVATFAVALGSDGARGWFLVADSVTRRVRVDEQRRDRLMFLAGEASAIVLHRDLDAEESETARFAGWRVLEDLEGYESNTRRSEVVGRRFEVGRLVVGLVEDDLVLPDERRQELAERARESIHRDQDVDEHEALLLGDLLHAYEAGDLPRLATVSLEAGHAAERDDHAHGALEMYRCSFEMAAALGEPETAIEAARSRGRVLRRRGQWAEADHWYGLALKIAERAELWDLIARTRAGLAVIHKDRGDLTAARSGFEGALDAAGSAKDADTTASIYQDLMNLEHVAGDLPVAARHGWRAVNTASTDATRTQCLVGFAWILKELGDIHAAEDAYAVARETADDYYYRLYAYDGYAHMAALRRDPAAFDARAAECDALGWRDGPATAKAEILYFRGVGHALLGRRDEARSWLEKAVAFAEDHAFEVVLDNARQALADLSGRDFEVGALQRNAVPIRSAAPHDVRDGLRAMRDEVLGALSA